MGTARRGALLLVVAAIVAACSPDATRAETAPEFCQAALADDGYWTTAVQLGGDKNGAMALVSGERVAGCRFLESARSGERHGTTQWAETPAASPQTLTYSVMLPLDETSDSSLAVVMTGRAPDGAALVRIVDVDGETSDATVGSGIWLAWLQRPAMPVVIEALDASGAVIGRIADPEGLDRPAGGPAPSPG